MIRPFLAGAALSLALAAPAFAVTQPDEGKADGRIRYVNYEPDNVVEIWSAPGAVLVIQFADDEDVVNVAATDSHTLISFPRSNFLFWKFKGCLIPQPVIVLTKLPSGSLRRYDFQVETRPQLCPAPGAPIATVDDPPNTAPADLKYISTDALAAGANVSYSVIFQYPHDTWLKKHAAALAARERANKENAETLLRDETERSTDPYTGQRNYRYLARGDTGLRPSQLWDNGYSTAFVFPGMQRMPSLYRISPDGKEATATYWVTGNMIIATGTAQEWRVRDGQTVMEFYNLNYNPVGQTPGTGTVSLWVTRTIKGLTMSVDLAPDSDGLSAVAGSRPPLTVRQKLGIVGLCGAVALTAILLGNLFGAHHKSDADKNVTDTGVAGLPFTAPPEPTPQPVQPPAPVPVSMPVPPRTIPTPQSGNDAALDAPIMSYSSNSNVASARRLADAGAANGQTGVDDPLSRALKPSDLGTPARASLLPHPTMTVPAGTVIPCTLQTAINSQLAGFVDCVLPAEVRGATGSVTLLDRGTQIFGEIRSALQQGQDRLFILWVRARTPQNVVISLASPAADELGRAGVPGAVDNHWWSRFGAAILFSVIGAGPEIASSALQNGNGNNYFQFLSPQQQLANTVLQAQINISPTLEKNQGDAVSIFVARDLDFSTVYDVRPTLAQ